MVEMRGTKTGSRFSLQMPANGLTIFGPDKGEAKFHLPSGKTVSIGPGEQTTISREDIGGYDWIYFERIGDQDGNETKG